MEQPQISEARETDSRDKAPSSLCDDLYSWLQALTFALLFLLIVFTFFGRVIGVDGHSMDSTLHDRDLLLLQCIAFEPEQGDVVVLNKPFADISNPIVKRVIATGGQTVSIDYSSGTVYVDGTALEEPYINEPMLQPSSPYMQQTEWTIPEGSVFVMGDNRNASSDSRDDRLGIVDSRYIIGRALCIMFPFGNMGSIS